MDGVDLVTVATLGQTIVLAVTLVMLILQFRSQEKAVKDAAYQKVLDDYNDVTRMLVDRPELRKLLDDLRRNSPQDGVLQRELSEEERVIHGYYMMIYSLLERTYLLYRKKWIDDGTWKQWSTWLKALGRDPIFRQVHLETQGMFDPAFRDYFSGITNSSKPSQTIEGDE